MHDEFNVNNNNSGFNYNRLNVYGYESNQSDLYNNQYDLSQYDSNNNNGSGRLGVD